MRASGMSTAEDGMTGWVRPACVKRSVRRIIQGNRTETSTNVRVWAALDRLAKYVIDEDFPNTFLNVMSKQVL